MTLEWKGDEIARKVDAALKQALPKLAEQVLTKAKQECPVDTGTLMRSGTVTMQNGGKTAELAFNTEYALYQHEVSLAHPKQGKAKYLEDPLRQEAPKVLRSLKDAAAKAIRG